MYKNVYIIYMKLLPQVGGVNLDYRYVNAIMRRRSYDKELIPDMALNDFIKNSN